jgi:hypothetical protein
MCRKLDLMGQVTSNATGRSRPKPVDHRIEKQPFNACVLREGGASFVGMRWSRGGTQRVVLSEEDRERQQIRDMAVVLQQTSPAEASAGVALNRGGASTRGTPLRVRTTIGSREARGDRVRLGRWRSMGYAGGPGKG